MVPRGRGGAVRRALLVLLAGAALAPAAARAQCAGGTCTLYATGDAETDTAQLQAALNSNPGGSRVVELNGTFRLTRNVYVNYDDTTIRGTGTILGPPFVFWPNTWQPYVGLRVWGGEHVAWTAATGVAISGSSLTKTTPDAWTGGAISTRALQAGSTVTPILSGDGYLEFTPGRTDTYRLIGLGNAANNARQPSLIDFALYMDASANLYVIERGWPVGWLGRYAATDRLRVGVDGGRIRYSRNGTELYLSRWLPQYPLIAAAALYSQGATIRDAVISGAIAPSSAVPDYPRRIMPAESRFAVPNALAPQDLVMVWNFPADGSKRRKEFAVVAADSTSATLSLADPVLHEYEAGVSFTPVAPRRNVVIQGVTLDTVAVNLDYARDFTIRDLSARRVGFRASACYACNVLNLDFDAKGDDPNAGTSSAVDFGEASRHVTIAGGWYRHYRGFEEPGVLKLNQVADATVRDLTVEDVHTIVFDHGFAGPGIPVFQADPRAKMAGIMIDTNVGNNRTGYTDIPAVGVTVSNVTADDADYGFFATSFSHTLIRDLKVIRYNRRYSDGAPVYIRGCEDVLLQDLFLPNVRDVLRIESSRRVLVSNTEAGRYINHVMIQDLGRIFPAWGTRRNSDVTFQGVTFWPRDFAPYENTLLPILYDIDGLRFSDVHFALDSWSGAPLGAAWFDNVRNVTARNVSVTGWPEAPLWAWTPVGGFLAGNSPVVFGGIAPWPLRADLPSVPAGRFNVLGEPDWSYDSDGTSYCRHYPAGGGSFADARPYDMAYTGECADSVGSFRVDEFTYFTNGAMFCMYPPGAALPATVYTFAKYPALPYSGYCW